MPKMLAALFLFATLAGGALPAVATEVVVNGVTLDEPTRRALERLQGIAVQPGRYWYDRVSGAWGAEGGPAAGQVAAGMPLGGPLRADASRGTTGVFVNGRELHALDLAALRRCTPVPAGRYWMQGDGIGGREGGPAQFDLAALCRAARRQAAGGAQCDDYGHGRINCSNARTGIGVIIEGGGRGGVFVDGKVISTPN